MIDSTKRDYTYINDLTARVGSSIPLARAGQAFALVVVAVHQTPLAVIEQSEVVRLF
jgi:hypothetical protein